MYKTSPLILVAHNHKFDNLILTSVMSREAFARFSLRGVCKLTIERTKIPKTYKIMVAERPRNFHPLNIVDHYYAVFVVFLFNLEKEEQTLNEFLDANCKRMLLEVR